MRLLCHNGSALCLLLLMSEEVDPTLDRPFIPNIEASCLQCFQGVDPESLPVFEPACKLLSGTGIGVIRADFNREHSIVFQTLPPPICDTSNVPSEMYSYPQRDV